MTPRNHIFCGRWLMLLSLLAAACFPAPAAEQAVGEYELKAAFIYNFTKFVEWPATPAEPADAPFVIGVTGDEAFGRRLAEVVRRETVRGHPIMVKSFSGTAVPANCRLLFVGRQEAEHLEALLKTVAGRAVLTVGETAGAATRGMMVNLLVVDGSIKMEINRAQVQQEHLDISSNLLKLAKIVGTKN